MNAIVLERLLRTVIITLFCLCVAGNGVAGGLGGTPPGPDISTTQAIKPPWNPILRWIFSKRKILTKDGLHQMMVNDFYKYDGSSFIGKTTNLIIARTNTYIITYYPPIYKPHLIDSFNIVIMGNDLKKARELAESTLLDALEISRPGACMLWISVGAPYAGNEQAANKEYGFSGCEGSIPLPPQ